MTTLPPATVELNEGENVETKGKIVLIWKHLLMIPPLVSGWNDFLPSLLCMYLGTERPHQAVQVPGMP